ncbi:MAG: DUF433 domain-containing protein [Nocardioides sp.]
MSYTPPLTATLTGATLRQLAYWRRPTASGPALLVPEFGSRPRVHYSFADVVALRTFVRLRQSVSLQGIRKSIAFLQENHPEKHLSRYVLRGIEGEETIVWISSEGEYLDVLHHPGDVGLKPVMESIFDAFTTESGREVPKLDEPAPGLSVDPDVRGGYPVIEDTRIPYNVIAGLVHDGLPSDEIRLLYPRATVESIAGAAAFDRLVERNRGDRRSALAAG